MTNEVFNLGDNVRYVGTTLSKKHADSVKKDKIGEVVAKVSGEPDAYVVSFGSDDFIVHSKSLVRHFFKDKVENPVEIERIVKKWDVSNEKS